MVKHLAIQQQNIFKIIAVKHLIHQKVFTHEVKFLFDIFLFLSLFSILGGYFPTPYTHQPELVMSDRRRSRDQYLYIPKYALNNTNVDRTNEIRKFNQVNFFNILFKKFMFFILAFTRTSRSIYRS
jgi:hypothetical protein